MFPILFFLFLFVPILELTILIKVGTLIGVWNTIFLNIFISAVGAFIARYEGLRVFIKMQDNLNKGLMPSNELMDGLMIFCAGILLLTPGFMTDMIGLLLLFPLTREIFKFFIKKKFKSMVESGETVSFHSNKPDKGHYHDIDI